jgi:hypothetical protein
MLQSEDCLHVYFLALDILFVCISLAKGLTRLTACLLLRQLLLDALADAIFQVLVNAVD